MDLSVVIPTYNRCTTLLRCLQALEEQTLERARYEIIVVDDGSTDATRATLRGHNSVRFFEQPRNAGPAAARNAGVRAAKGALVLFLGDDIIARPQLLEQHCTAHAAEQGEHIAVLGYAPWGEQQEVTPLMRYVFDGRAFPQFLYHEINDPEQVPYGFFYTCNISLKHDFLLRCGLFDETFHDAYGEDTELAYRLQQCGMRIVFRKQIIAEHYHPTSYRSACRRARVAGASTIILARKHPQLANLGFLRFGLKTRFANWGKRQMTQIALDPLLAFADQQRWDHPLLAQAYDWALRKHQLWGLMDAVSKKTNADSPGCS